MTIKYFVLLPRDAVLARCIPVFEKTCAATQKNVKCHVFLDFEKKNVKYVFWLIHHFKKRKKSAFERT